MLSKVFKKVDTCLSSDAHDPSHVFENCVLLTAQKTCIDKGGVGIAHTAMYMYR